MAPFNSPGVPEFQFPSPQGSQASAQRLLVFDGATSACEVTSKLIVRGYYPVLLVMHDLDGTCGPASGSYPPHLSDKAKAMIASPRAVPRRLCPPAAMIVIRRAILTP